MLGFPLRSCSPRPGGAGTAEGSCLKAPGSALASPQAAWREGRAHGQRAWESCSDASRFSPSFFPAWEMLGYG